MLAPQTSSISRANAGHSAAECRANRALGVSPLSISAVAASIPADAQVAPRPACARSSTVTSAPACCSRQPMESPATPAPITTTFIQLGGSYLFGLRPDLGVSYTSDSDDVRSCLIL